MLQAVNSSSLVVRRSTSVSDACVRFLTQGRWQGAEKQRGRGGEFAGESAMPGGRAVAQQAAHSAQSCKWQCWAPAAAKQCTAEASDEHSAVRSNRAFRRRVLTPGRPQHCTHTHTCWCLQERRQTHEAATVASEEGARLALKAAEHAAKLREEALKEREELKAKKNLSWSQKEKKKRDGGQQSRGKSTVEEEKRIARQFGVYSGFD